MSALVLLPITTLRAKGGNHNLDLVNLVHNLLTLDLDLVHLGYNLSNLDLDLVRRPMDIRQLFPTQWITCDDLGERRFRLTISAVTHETVHDRHTHAAVNKLVVAFKGRQKRLILNKTQALTLAGVCGSYETEQWIGKEVILRAGLAPNKKPTIVIEAPTGTE